MSIATDEAESKYPVLNDETLGSDSAILDYENKLKQEGFIAGAAWQAQREPTEIQINAAAKAKCDNDHRISVERGHLNIRPAWNSASKSVRDIYRKYALMALTAARKAVKE